MDKKLIYWTSITLVALTKTVREDIGGQLVDADEAVSLQMVDRADRKLRKVEFDMTRTEWLEFYKKMAHKPAYQQWIPATKEELAIDENAKGHWEKLK